MSILFQNATWPSPDNRSWERGDILVEGEAIRALGSGVCEARTAAETVDCTGLLVIPGLINAHTHSYTGFLKGSVDAVPLDLYMLLAIAGGSERTAREIYISTLVEALQMLRAGVTSAVDHFSQRSILTPEGISAAAQAFEDAGMRVNLALMYADLPFFDSLPLKEGELPMELRGPSGPSQPPEEYIALAGQAHRAHSGGRVRVMLGTDGPQRCSDRLLELTGALEEAYHMGWQTHALESKTQVISARRRFGRGLVEQMDAMGLLNERLSLVHGVWLSPEEIELVGRRGAALVHCPSSNLHLGSGVAPVRQYLDHSVPVALGSDGGNCGATGMLEQLRLAARLSRITDPDDEKWLTAADALTMDYKGGARVMGRTDIGAIRVGAQADLTLLSTGDLDWQPAGDLTRQLVYAESGRHVRAVYVAGEQVMRDGVSTRVDEADVMGEALEIAARLRRENEPRFRLAERQMPYLRTMYRREMARDVGFDRFCGG